MTNTVRTREPRFFSRRIAQASALASCFAALAACGDDGSTTAGATGTDTDAQVTGATANGTAGVATAMTGTATASGSASATGTAGLTSDGTDTASDTGTDTGTDGGSKLVTVSGKVQDFVANKGVPDAGISLHGRMGFETMSDAMGLYSMSGLTPNEEVFFILAESTDYVAGVRPLQVGSQDMTDIDLAQLPKSFIDQQFMLLDELFPMEAVTPDPDAGIVLVRLLQNTAAGPGVTVNLEPAPAPGTYYVPGAGKGVPVLNSTEIAFNLLPVAVFYNVAPGSDLTIDVTHPDRECTVLHPNAPVLARHITLIEVSCPPTM